MLTGRHILVGISGGIAAYKIPELIRQLKKAGAEVKVTSTQHALEFVTELTLRTVSGNSVYSDVFASVNAHSTEHISLPDWADMMVIAPATANVLGKMAYGIADDALTTTFAAMRKPVVIAPAMNDKMYASEPTQAAIRILQAMSHVTVLDCAEGELACGVVGKGRMQEVPYILESVYETLTEKSLKGKKILITAGPTRERIDPVRYLSNDSTGKMGYALARVCHRHGAEVILVSGPTALPCPKDVLRVDVESAQAMYEATVAHFKDADMAILCAAVADFTPCEVNDRKIKKESSQEETALLLKRTPDIAEAIGHSKKAGQVVVGFALETDHEREHAIAKLQSKALDYIVLNSLRDAGAGFGGDTNKVTIYSSDGSEMPLPLASKDEIAEGIVKHICC